MPRTCELMRHRTNSPCGRPLKRAHHGNYTLWLLTRKQPMPLAEQNRNASMSAVALAAQRSASFFWPSRRGNRLMAVAVVVRNLIG